MGRDYGLGHCGQGNVSLRKSRIPALEVAGMPLTQQGPWAWHGDSSSQLPSLLAAARGHELHRVGGASSKEAMGRDVAACSQDGITHGTASL